MFTHSRVLVRAAFAAGLALLMPSPVVAVADVPTAPALCSAEQEREAGDSADTAELCLRLLMQSAEARRVSVPVPEDPEKITPFEMKTEIGVSPGVRKSLYGEPDNSDGIAGYQNTATRAAYFTGFYTATQGGDLYTGPPEAETEVREAERKDDAEAAAGLHNYLAQKAGAGYGKSSHNDKDLDPKLLAAKKTALTAEKRAKALKYIYTDGSEETVEPTDPEDMEASDNTPAVRGVDVQDLIAADKAEAAAVDAARTLGWLK